MKKVVLSILILVLSISFCFTALNCKKKKTSESESSSISTSQSNSSGQSNSQPNQDPPKTPEKKELNELVDFIVDVEAGRDIRVLQLTDIQTIDAQYTRFPNRGVGTSKTDIFLGYQRYVAQVIERYNPDFIIMTGDNVYGEFDDSGEHHLALIEFMESFKIPWAPVFGNHDNESNMGVDWQCEQYENAEYCLFDQKELTGNGNYSVALTQGGEVKRVFYMLDSNGCGNMSQISFSNGHSRREAGFGDDQIEWYTDSITDLKVSFPDVKLSMAFHIQISAFEDALKQYGYNSATIRSYPIDLDKNADAKAKGDFGYIGRPLKGPWDQDRTVWKSIKALGIDSLFVGHEHCNSASVTYQGVRFTYGQKSSTYDRYNLIKADGTIASTSETYQGTPVMGGTFINLSKTDGAISDGGLYLYDHDLGYQKPEKGEITYDNIQSSATKIELDFNDTDFDLDMTTPEISSAVSKVTTGAPSGTTGDVYGRTTDHTASVGIKFNDTVNANKLLAIFVKMYVSDYTVTTAKNPLLRIYPNDKNVILSEVEFSSVGGENDKWVYINILDMVKSSSGVVEANVLINPFTLVYRFYGETEGTIYFDSLTIVANGDPYVLDAPLNADEEEIRGEVVKKYTASALGITGDMVAGSYQFAKIKKQSYSVSFTMKYSTLERGLDIYGYCMENDSDGILVRITKNSVIINNEGRSSEGYDTTYENTIYQNVEYQVEVGFVNLYNENTVYVYVKINGVLIGWEVVESYERPIGNICIALKKGADKVTIS